MLQLLLNITIFSFALGQLGALFSLGSGKLYLFDVLALLYSSFGFIYLLFKKSLKLYSFHIYFLLFLLTGVFSLIFSSAEMPGADFLSGVFYCIRFVSYLFAGVVTHNLVLQGKIDLKNIYKAFAIAGVIFFVLGVAQLILLPDFSVLDQSLGWDPHKNRMASSLFDPNFLGGFFVLLFILLVTKKFFKKPIRIFLSLLFLIGIFFTFSRSSYLALAIFVLLYGLKKNILILFLGLFVAFSSYYFVPRIQTRISNITDPADSASLRVLSWKNALYLFFERPILGFGYNSFRYFQIEKGVIEVAQYDAHGSSGSDASLLLVLATTGIIGFIFYVLGVSSIEPYFLLPLLAQALFINVLFFPVIMFFMFTVLCIRI